MAYPTRSGPAAVDSNSKSAIRASINSIIPPELLALAFSFIVSDAVEAISLESPGGPAGAEVQRQFSQHPLLNASLVCRAWYKTIKDTPTFWAFVVIGVRPLSEPRTNTTMPPVPPQKGESKGVEILLERSGRLPLTIVMCPENIQDFDSVSEAIQKHFDRLEVLSLIALDNRPESRRSRFPPMPYRTTVQQGLGLLDRPMPRLKLLSLAMCFKPLGYGRRGRLKGIRKDVDAPKLETLSCHFHLIIPQSPTRLSSLSLIRADVDQLGPRPVELPNLVDLRIEHCEADIILSSFVTPSLRRLVVKNWNSHRTSIQLPRYDSLQELQWADTVVDPVFVQLFPLCPNLKRYSSYVERDSIQQAIKEMDELIDLGGEILRPMILAVFDEGVLGGENAYRQVQWPGLEEVSLDHASCDHVATLIKAVPSIKRVRVLRDPVLFLNLSDQERERDKLAVLRGKVEMAFGAEPWGSGSSTTETRPEVTVTL
ncbi:hypothetical protein FRC00_013980 [Tulasnella sp. 408]|nr:hypothetical protein FRC00_013980 [Tulasnella sp. 408]